MDGEYMCLGRALPILAGFIHVLQAEPKLYQRLWQQHVGNLAVNLPRSAHLKNGLAGSIKEQITSEYASCPVSNI